MLMTNLPYLCDTTKHWIVAEIMYALVVCPFRILALLTRTGLMLKISALSYTYSAEYDTCEKVVTKLYTSNSGTTTTYSQSAYMFTKENEQTFLRVFETVTQTQGNEADCVGNAYPQVFKEGCTNKYDSGTETCTYTEGSGSDYCSIEYGLTNYAGAASQVAISLAVLSFSALLALATL